MAFSKPYIWMLGLPTRQKHLKYIYIPDAEYVIIKYMIMIMKNCFSDFIWRNGSVIR